MQIAPNRMLATFTALTLMSAGFMAASGGQGSAAGINPNQNVDTTVTGAALAQALVGAGVSVSYVAFTGASDSKGTFAFTDPKIIGMNSGIVLSSGNANDVVGPNTSDSYSTAWGQPGDPTLDALSTYPTYDASVLEFDFTPTANQVAFQYSFASDEYPEWVQTAFNDTFGFFINGVNCATVRQVAGDPTSPFVPVAINNINDSNPVQSPMPTSMRPDLFHANYADPLGGPSAVDLELDGHTSVMSCQAPVTPGVTNHMKLAIADASDGIYDSAVFIQAGSLVSNENPIADLGITPDSGASPLPVTASIEGTDPNNLPLTYSLAWGDGTTSNGNALPDKTALAQHVYEYGGDYLVTLTVSNGTLSGVDTEDVTVSGAGAPNVAGTPPYITSEPKDQDALTGSDFAFTATAGGDPAPSIQWQESTNGGVTWENLDGETAASFSGVASSAQDGSTFKAVFTNAAGTVESLPVSLAVAAVKVDTSSSPSAPVAGQGVTLTADISSATLPSLSIVGKVRFYDGANLLATKNVVGGVATLLTKKLALGTHGIVAQYLATTTATPVDSSARIVTVSAPHTTTTVSGSAKAHAGVATTFRAIVRIASPGHGKIQSGTVTFFDNGIAIGTSAVTRPVVTFLTVLGAGSHSITAAYSGTSGLLPSPQSTPKIITAT